MGEESRAAGCYRGLSRRRPLPHEAELGVPSPHTPAWSSIKTPMRGRKATFPGVRQSTKGIQLDLQNPIFQNEWRDRLSKRQGSMVVTGSDYRGRCLLRPGGTCTGWVQTPLPALTRCVSIPHGPDVGTELRVTKASMSPDQGSQESHPLCRPGPLALYFLWAVAAELLTGLRPPGPVGGRPEKKKLLSECPTRAGSWFRSQAAFPLEVGAHSGTPSASSSNNSQ